MIRRLHVLAHGDRSIDVAVGSFGASSDVIALLAAVGVAGGLVGYALTRSLVITAAAAGLAVFVAPIALVVFEGPR